MADISLTFTKSSNNFYIFKVVQDSQVIFKKSYTAGKKYDEGEIWINQAELFGGYTRYLNDLVKREQDKNPDFHWESFKAFKRWAGAKAQADFFEHELKYVPKREK